MVMEMMEEFVVMVSINLARLIFLDLLVGCSTIWDELLLKDPPVGSDQGLKKRNTRKDTEPLKGSKSKEPKSSSSKGSKSKTKSSGKSAQGKEPVFDTTDTEIPQDQGGDLGNTKDQSSVEDDSKHDCKMAKARKPPTTFDELMSTPIDFSAYVLHNQKIDNLTQAYLVGPVSIYSKGHAKAEWNSKFILKNVISRKFKHDVFSNKRIIAVTHVKVVKKYDYGYLDEIIVRREDQQLYKFVERDFLRLNLRDIEDMLLLLVQKKLSKLETDDLFDLNVALQMFTRCVVILKQVEDLQLRVESY
nr:hypothetical protein [Tanacetum cinerariifolium]